MASINEIKAQLAQAVRTLEDAAAHVGTAANQADDAKLSVMAAFEGSGRDDFLELLGRLDRLALTLSDSLVDVLQVGTAINDSIASL